MKYNQLLSQVKDPAIQDRWRLTMPDQAYPFQCIAESVDFGFRNTPSKQRQAQGRTFNYADFSTLDAINVVFYETYDFEVTNYLNIWKRKIYDPVRGVFGPPKSYERPIVIEMLNDDDSVVQTLTYKAAWPTDTSPITAPYEDASGRIQITQAFIAKDLVLS